MVIMLFNISIIILIAIYYYNYHKENRLRIEKKERYCFFLNNVFKKKINDPVIIKEFLMKQEYEYEYGTLQKYLTFTEMNQFFDKISNNRTLLRYDYIHNCQKCRIN